MRSGTSPAIVRYPAASMYSLACCISILLSPTRQRTKARPVRVYAVLVSQFVGKAHLRVKIVNCKARGEYHEIGCTGHVVGGSAGMGRTVKNKQVELLRSGQSGADTREGFGVNFRRDLVCNSALETSGSWWPAARPYQRC